MLDQPNPYEREADRQLRALHVESINATIKRIKSVVCQLNTVARDAPDQESYSATAALQLIASHGERCMRAYQSIAAELSDKEIQS